MVSKIKKINAVPAHDREPACISVVCAKQLGPSGKMKNLALICVPDAVVLVHGKLQKFGYLGN